jgi:hypothetical protein
MVAVVVELVNIESGRGRVQLRAHLQREHIVT